MTCYIIQCKYLNGNQNANHLFSDQWFTILEFYSFFFFQSGLRDYILKARTLNANSREILTKQQKHVSIIPISSGEVRSFILMVPSLKIKAKKKINMEDYSQKATYYLYNQKGNYKLVKTSEHLHTLLISFMMFQEFSRSLLSIIVFNFDQT